MAELRLSKSSINYLDDIIAYISLESEENAKLFVAKIIHSAETTAIFPYSGRIVPELNDEQIREKVYHNIRIIYRMKDNVMEVIRVLHSARDFPELNE